LLSSSLQFDCPELTVEGSDLGVEDRDSEGSRTVTILSMLKDKRGAFTVPHGSCFVIPEGLIGDPYWLFSSGFPVSSTGQALLEFIPPLAGQE